MLEGDPGGGFLFSFLFRCCVLPLPPSWSVADPFSSWWESCIAQQQQRSRSRRYSSRHCHGVSLCFSWNWEEFLLWSLLMGIFLPKVCACECMSLSKSLDRSYNQTCEWDYYDSFADWWRGQRMLEGSMRLGSVFFFNSFLIDFRIPWAHPAPLPSPPVQLSFLKSRTLAASYLFFCIRVCHSFTLGDKGTKWGLCVALLCWLDGL